MRATWGSTGGSARWAGWIWLLCLIGWLPPGNAQSAAPVHAVDGQWLTDWLVLDRYLPNAQATMFLTNLWEHAPEAPREAGVWTSSAGEKCTWQRIQRRGDFFNVRAAVGREYQNKSAFLFCHLLAPRAGEAELWLSSRPAVRVWLNGVELERASYHYDDQFKGKGTGVYEGQVRAGTNDLLLEVSQLGLERGLAVRALPPERTVLSGPILDASGQALRRDVRIVATQAGKELARLRTGDSGAFRLSVRAAPNTPCEISFTYGEEGHWWRPAALPPGARLQHPVRLAPAVSLAGTVTMLDALRTPQREVAVQALRQGVPVASTLTDERGNFSFVNLAPGDYQVRCHTPTGYRYWRPDATAPEETNVPLLGAIPTVPVREGEPVRGLSFRFAPYKSGAWRRFDALDGLPNNKVQKIVRTVRGELWFQTDLGVGSFDGQRFTTLPSTVGKPITALAAADDGSLWYGTYTGLYRLSQGTLTEFTTAQGLPDNLVNCLCASPKGGMWVGTDYGLALYEGGRFRAWTARDGLIQDDVTQLERAPDGSLWIGTSGGLARFDGTRFASFTRAEGLLSTEVTAIDCASATAVRVATVGGVAVLDGGRFVPLCAEPQFARLTVRDIHSGADGRLWLGTDFGLTIVDGSNQLQVPAAAGPGGSNVRSILPLPDGTYWFATDSGVAHLNPGLLNFGARDGLADNRVFDVCAHPDGGLWVGMEWAGVSRFDGRMFRTVQPGLYARRLHCTPDGWIWIGCNKGVLRHTGSAFLPGGLLDTSWIMAIDHDPLGGLWFGGGWAGGGLTHLRTNALGELSLKIYTRNDGLADDQVNEILCLPGGITWAGTVNGASCFDGTRFHNFTTRDGLPNNAVRAIRQGPDGALWFGTDAGIARYAGGAFVNLGAQAGLPPTRVWSICVARDGVIWFGTDTHGAWGFDGQTFTTFDTRDGLADNSVTSIIQDRAGHLWFGTMRAGLTRYDRSTNSPQVRFSRVRAAGQLLDTLRGEARLRLGELALVSYEGFDWTSPQLNRQFRLALHSPNSPASVRITRQTEWEWIPDRPGTYTLEVQSISRDLVYSTPARLTLAVFVPWHQRNLVRVPALLVVLGALLSAAILGYKHLAHRREARRWREMLFEQEQAARAALEGKNRQLEQNAQALRERQQQLEEALANVKTLRGLVPICASCKKIRDDRGFWQQLETFVQKHSEAQFSHGMCPECVKRWYPNINLDD